MIIEKDELVVWEEKSHMIIGGEVVDGTFMITNRRLLFVQITDQRSLMKVKRTESEIWEVGIWDVLDLDLMEMKRFGFPLVRVRYKEDEVFFTFPDLKPRPALAAMVVFMNHARLINKNVSLMKNIVDNLRSGELKVGERMPKLVIDQPMRLDETCHQCAKTMLEEETNLLASEIRECIICDTEE